MVVAGQSYRLVAKTFMVSVACVVKWSQRQRAGGRSGGAEDWGGRRLYPVAQMKPESGLKTAFKHWAVMDRPPYLSL